MMPYDHEYDGADIARLWNLVTEFSEQLNQIKNLVASLQAQAHDLKMQALHSETGFVLRRFNTNMSKESFETEVSRMNGMLAEENQSLQHDNKQLSLLLKEYEQTLESVMGRFRSRAHEAQIHELSITRHYERLVLSRETADLTQELANATNASLVMSRLSSSLRAALRLEGGEEPESEGPRSEDLLDEGRGYKGPDTETEVDWALERECELVRLEKENEELRRMLGVGAEGLQERIAAKQIIAPRNAHLELRKNRRRVTGSSSIGFGLQRSSSGWSEREQWPESGQEQPRQFQM
ncbi:hypothetical protein SISSUDRAFT_15202 [Sistotremastrum suecicum HHB10207 ss-3]|uniref:Uncharacterized protein n=1 Tax=Sistotremastrum suecicum HHB10207 ss-3 TaxID=1314776 RepID=A0A166J689_9AGAM|nr:hypothetical protein SISSUDRAFT_15202 [Sistotremastrum suecicum HHB10207 ss-3]